MKTLELLAPAKNLEIGTAAIDCGADAVYIAGPKFGAREKAGNSFEDITALCSYAHRYAAKVYITVNTILKEEELSEAEKYIHNAQRCGCDAVIVQDLGVLKMNLPLIKLFASTQCDIRTPQKAQLLESLGFDRLILARELSLDQIAEIRNAVGCSLETFVHGALCVCYSGQCYLSEYLTGRSANRGECAQPCRSNYDLVGEGGEVIIKNAPLLSLKDLNLSGRISDLIEAGVTSFKIEGRMKNASYVKNIVTLYSRALNNYISSHRDSFCRASVGVSKPSFESDALATFNRGYTEYFLNGHKREDRKEKIGSVVAKYIGRPFGKIATALLTSNKHGEVKIVYNPLKKGERLNNGDGLSFVLKGGCVAGARVNSATEKDAYLQFADIKENTVDKLKDASIFRALDYSFEKAVSQKVQRQIPIKLSVNCINKSSDSEDINNCMVIVCTSCEHLLNSVLKDAAPFVFCEESFKGDNPQKCLDIIKTQLSKESGDFLFKVEEVKGTPRFYRAAVLNKIRREVAERLSELIESERVNSGLALEERDRIAEEVSKDIVEKAMENSWSNCANSYSKAVYKECGFEPEEYVPYKRFCKVLMRTKYCLRSELGMCLMEKGPATEKNRGKLFLRNNGRELSLEFDCKKCEMMIVARDKKE